ncbi:MAG: helix-turn-helix transcriptional regulator [Ruminococcus sp.]|nr:helix-turn-helix transcriptional regulator [Ruminococcus sp.]
MDKNIDYKALGKRIKNKRKEKHLTQEQLSEICDLSAAHIGHIERGTRILSVDVLVRLSKALDVSLDYLLFDVVSDNENVLKSINPILKETDKKKADYFLNTVRLLAENLDEL